MMHKMYKIVSDIERESMRTLLSKRRRIDGRGLEDFRKIEIETGVVEKAEGSAMVKLGDTKVVVGVKAEIGAPFPDTPNKGVLTVNAEFVPTASPFFEPGPPDEDAIELARVVDRGLRESEAIDLEKLCLVEGEKVWILFVDLYILDHSGNLFDASALGAIAALLTTKIPKVEVQEDEIKVLDEEVPLPMRHIPVSVTFAKIGDSIIVDPCIEEEQVMDACLTITVDEEGHLVSMQKGGSGTFDVNDINYMLETALRKAKDLREKLPKVSLGD